MDVVVSFSVLDRIEKIHNHRGSRGFGVHSCYDYIEALILDGDKCGVTVFIEPGGDITKWGPSWEWVLDWWFQVLIRQPNVDYLTAGWHLYDLKDALPDDPDQVWLGLKPTGD